MRLALSLLALISLTAHAQWQIQDPHTTADLRGIHALGDGVAWASGTHGTVLRTEDAGFVWQLCAIPPGAEHLDFRAIQAIDNNTALVLSSGPGDLSRLYKTTDGCQTWKLVLTNTDPEGFWDALQIAPIPGPTPHPDYLGLIVGDPVRGQFVQIISRDSGDHWARIVGGQAGTPPANLHESLFAASNSSLLLTGQENDQLLVTGGLGGPRSIVLSQTTKPPSAWLPAIHQPPPPTYTYLGGSLPLAHGESAGAFAVARRYDPNPSANTLPDDKSTILLLTRGTLVAVGGDYKLPASTQGTAAYSTDSGLHWTAATTPPHGYRSSVVYDPKTSSWIAVGPNGTDLSTDDGRNWHALKPSGSDAPDADQHWNAISLPFVVGPHGRIGYFQPKK
jgi:photosystem II stability/assembly factor-like uncharacterized protein